MLICPEASSAQNNIAAVSADGSTVCVLIRRLNSSCRRSIAFVVLALRHWLGGRRVKLNRRSPASSRQSATGRWRSRIDHVGIIGGYLFMQALGRVGKQIPVFVNGASLYRYAFPDGGKRLLESRRAVDDEELRSPQTTLDQVVEDRAPGFRAFSAHA